ncbi:MAG TPA: glycerate kinase [Candidatus Micrarchaeaceae archaeon]|nr:glycerate kinase [Candidatus Micrarchaeaceae archaeon]
MPQIRGRRVPSQILIAPNAFKGTLTAAEAARAITEGVNSAWPGTNCRSTPLADGGDGFLETLMAGREADIVTRQVAGPLLAPVWARAGRRLADEGATAVLELAASSGLSLIPHPTPHTAARASTMGLGELILDMIAGGAEEIWIGLGGSASTDGGAGMAQALGFGLLDSKGDQIRAGGIGLGELDRIDARDVSPLLGQARIVAACDVDNPLLGPRGAAAAFAPQKGADLPTVQRLEHGLARLAQIVERDLRLAPIGIQPGMGAAGGTAFGLASFAGARLESGVSVVAAWVGLDRALEEADLVITGEGRFDLASLRGKVTGEVLLRSAQLGVPCLVLAGSAEPESEAAARELGGWLFLAPGEGGLTPVNQVAAYSRLREATRRACLELYASNPEPGGGLRA